MIDAQVPHSLRIQNKSLVLNIIRVKKEISRAQLAKETGLTRATVSQIVNDLLKDNLIRETGTDSNAMGRKGIHLSFNDAYGYVVGIDLGGTKICLSASDFNGTILHKHTVRTFESPDKQSFLASFTTAIKHFIHESGLEIGQMKGIGVASPGIIDYKNGIIVEGSPNIPDWEETELALILTETFDVVAVVENDVRSGLLGEMTRGKARGVQNAVLISIGTGIGSSIMVDGKIVRGMGNAAGEIGYYLFTPEQLQKKWTQLGCMESIVSGTGLIAYYQSLTDDQKSPAFKTTADLFKAAKNGEARAMEMMDIFTDHLAIAILNLMNTVNPEKIILTGGVSRSAEQFLPRLQEWIDTHSFKRTQVEIEVSQLFEDGALYGISLLAIQAALPEFQMIQQTAMK
ncbi:ROK family transcriptional regulator [Salisediminibacterium beveridgei]|uniref:ROK family transcriptional regulator n=1 Tax=Salisediminibacterium beveridgei TaxID=632773 RepID=A0A1D7QRX7_9BACI|nr:ROK family transcriptional regulator [Salisediminibacterium beveridgei]AOM81749.1 ROK family transcriptional regulator [Salisediminibacterium beveridgei]